MTVTIFIVVPRVATNPWQASTNSSGRQTGFDEEVELGELGKIVEDPTIALRIQFINEQTGEAIQLVGRKGLHPPVWIAAGETGFDRSSRAYQALVHLARDLGIDNQGQVCLE